MFYSVSYAKEQSLYRFGSIKVEMWSASKHRQKTLLRNYGNKKENYKL